MERVKVLKVKKTEETFTPQGTDKVLYKHLVALEDGRKGWTFSEKFQPGEMEIEVEDARASVDGTWYDYKFKLPKRDFAPGGNGGYRETEDDYKAKQRGMARAHAQEMAIRRIATEVSLGLLDKDSYNQTLLLAYTDFFARDAAGVEAKAAPLPTFSKPAPKPEEEEINLDDIPF